MFTGKKLVAIIVCLQVIICGDVFAKKSVFIISQHLKPTHLNMAD